MTVLDGAGTCAARFARSRPISVLVLMAGVTLSRCAAEPRPGWGQARSSPHPRVLFLRQRREGFGLEETLRII